MNASVIIPVYQRTEWIKKCIDRLVGLKFEGEFEVIVIDDGSPNGSEIQRIVELFSSKTRNKILYLRQNKSGPAAARNRGVRQSKGTVLCFIDDDSIVDTNWLQEIVDPFRRSSSTGIVSGRTLSLYRSGLPLLLERAVYSGKNWATCNIAYRRDVFEAVGGFDECFSEASWEDNDLGLRVRWAGFTHIYNENAIVYHPHETSLPEYKQKCIRNGRGAAAFSRKYIFKKPLWGVGTPLIMSRHLIYAFWPTVWMRRSNTEKYLKFLWSLYSMQGYFEAIVGKRNGKN